MLKGSDVIHKSIYFKKPEDIRLYNWVIEEDMPDKQIATFTGYIRALIAREWERVNMENDAIQLSQLNAKLDDVLHMLEGGITVVEDQPARPTSLPEQSVLEGLDILVDDEEW